MRIFISSLVLMLGMVVPGVSQSSPTGEPFAKPHPVTTQNYGISITDDYAWLKADNWQQALSDPSVLPREIQDYLKAENAYFYEKMAATAPLQKTLYQELIGRVLADDSTVPSVDNAYAYFWRDVQDKNYRLLFRRPGNAFKSAEALFSLEPSKYDVLILDANALAIGKPSFTLGATKHTQDHRLLAYSVDYDGSEHYQIFVRDLSTGKNLTDHLIDTDGNIVWLLDGRGFFYVRLDNNSRARSVWRHRLGTPQDKDLLVYETPEKSGFSTSVWLTRNHKYFGIGVGDYHTGEVYLIDAQKPQSQPQLITNKEPDLQYGISQHADRLFIRTNADGADDFKIMVAPLKTPQRKHWQELIRHKPGRLIVSIEVFANYLVRKERENGLEQLVIHRLSDGKEHTVITPLTDEAYSLNYSSGYEFDTNILRINYSSLTTPSRVYDYDMETRKFVLRKQQQIPSGHIINNYITRRISAPAHDGEQIPVTLLYHKDTLLDGAAPIFIQSYGAYGRSQHAYFRANALSLVNRGFILVLAHVRGGMDKGYSWYTNGRLDKKMNTFRDFISVAEYLISKKYTSPGQIVAYGSSAGGMIMGYSANQDSKLFCAMVMDVPFVDVLNTMLDESLPLTPGEWSEWGNPARNVEDFKTILAYSPYENVRAKAYPHMLVLGSVSDSRVTYWEPAKWVAKLRALRTNDNALMLRTDMTSGHSGATGRYRGLQGVAMIYAFAIKAVGGSRCSIP
jgi:oligopeptidase B